MKAAVTVYELELTSLDSAHAQYGDDAGVHVIVPVSEAYDFHDHLIQFVELHVPAREKS